MRDVELGEVERQERHDQGHPDHRDDDREPDNGDVPDPPPLRVPQLPDQRTPSSAAGSGGSAGTPSGSGVRPRSSRTTQKIPTIPERMARESVAVDTVAIRASNAFV